MSLRTKGPAVILSVITAILLLYLAAANAALNRVAADNAKDRLASLAALLQGQMDTSKGAAESRAEIIAAIPGVAEAIVKDDREELLRLCGPPMQRQRVKLGMDQAHFANTEGKMILRLSDPQKFGDSIKPHKGIMLATMDRGENLNGVEISANGPAMFGDAPVKLDGKTVGCYEVGLPFVLMVDSLKRVHTVDTAAMFDEQLLRTLATNVDTRYSSEDVVGRFAKVYSSDWTVVSACIKGHPLDGSSPTTFISSFEGTEYGVAVVPITDIKGKVIGCLASCRDHLDARGRIHRTMIVQLFLTFVALILVAGVVKVVVNGWILRPIVALGPSLNDPKMLKEYTDRKDEIGDLARHLMAEQKS